MSLILAGKILGAHHLKGAVKVFSNIEEIDKLLNHKIMIKLADGNIRLLTVRKAEKFVGNKWIFEFEEIKNKNDAMSLCNGMIEVNKDIVGISEDEHLVAELFGMKAIDYDNGEFLGLVDNIFETAAHSIFVIDSEDFEIMVPDIEEFIKDIDYEKKEIKIRLLEGMKDPKVKK